MEDSGLVLTENRSVNGVLECFPKLEKTFPPCSVHTSIRLYPLQLHSEQRDNGFKIGGLTWALLFSPHLDLRII